MKTRWAVRFLLFVGGLAVATALVVRTEFAGRVVCAQGQRLAARLGGVDVAADRCAIEPFATRLVVEGLRIADPADPTGEPAFAAKRVAVRLVPWLAFGGVPAVGEVEVEAPRVSLDLSHPKPDDDDPPAEDGCLSPLRQLRVGRLSITGGSARLALPGGRTATVAGVDLTARRRSGVYFVEAGLSGALAGGPEVRLDRLAAKARLDPGDETLALDAATLALPEGTIDVAGEVRRSLDNVVTVTHRWECATDGDGRNPTVTGWTES